MYIHPSISKDRLDYATTDGGQHRSNLIWHKLIFHLCKCTPSPGDIAHFCLLSFIIETHSYMNFKGEGEKGAHPVLSRSENIEQHLMPTTIFSSFGFTIYTYLITLTRNIHIRSLKAPHKILIFIAMSILHSLLKTTDWRRRNSYPPLLNLTFKTFKEVIDHYNKWNLN